MMTSLSPTPRSKNQYDDVIESNITKIKPEPMITLRVLFACSCCVVFCCVCLFVFLFGLGVHLLLFF